MIRKIDHLGRIVIPKEARKSLKISEETPLDISWDAKKGRIVLQKSESACSICGTAQELITKNEIVLCKKCFEKLLDTK